MSTTFERVEAFLVSPGVRRSARSVSSTKWATLTGDTFATHCSFCALIEVGGFCSFTPHVLCAAKDAMYVHAGEPADLIRLQRYGEEERE